MIINQHPGHHKSWKHILKAHCMWEASSRVAKPSSFGWQGVARRGPEILGVVRIFIVFLMVF